MTESMTDEIDTDSLPPAVPRLLDPSTFRHAAPLEPEYVRGLREEQEWNALDSFYSGGFLPGIDGGFDRYV